MKAILIGLLALISIIILNACGACTSKKYSCDDNLDKDALDWLQIDSGKRFIYKYNSLYDTFTIVTYNKSSDEYARSGGFESKQIPCENSIYAKSAELDTAGNSILDLRLNLETYYPSKNKIYDATLSIHGNGFRITNFTESDIEPFNTNKTILQNVTLANGINYQLINVLEQDSLLTKYNQPYKLYFAYNVGLVAYETFPLHQLWIIQ